MRGVTGRRFVRETTTTPPQPGRRQTSQRRPLSNRTHPPTNRPRNHRLRRTPNPRRKNQKRNHPMPQILRSPPSPPHPPKHHLTNIGASTSDPTGRRNLPPGRSTSFRWGDRPRRSDPRKPLVRTRRCDGLASVDGRHRPDQPPALSVRAEFDLPVGRLRFVSGNKRDRPRDDCGSVGELQRLFDKFGIERHAW